jgi:hypothetical protein
VSGIATAIGGAAVVGYLGAQSAAHTQAGGQKQAAATQQHMFDTVVGQEQPFLNAGYGATTSLSNLLGTSGKRGGVDPATGLPIGYLTQTFNPTQAQLDNYPGYQFALKTGGQATRNADTPGMGALSGAALKDLTNFNVGTANQYYGQYFDQFQRQQNNIFDRLSNIASMGQNAAGNLGSVGSNLGTGIAQAQAGAAASQAGGIVGGTNALAGGLSTAALMHMYGDNGGNNAASAEINGGVNSIYKNYGDYVNPPPTEAIGGS